MLSLQITKKFSKPGTPTFVLQVNETFVPGFTVLFGPSGAGKSTLLDCVAGLFKPDSGKIQLDEETFFDSEKNVFLPPQKRGIGYVFQSLALFPHMSIEENVKYGITRLATTEQSARLERVLDSFHIGRLRARKPGELSGGEKQRVALARSVITNPRVLLLDEPLTGLDAGLRSDILEDLRGWNAEHRVPILYVTHNREEVNAIGDRVVTMVEGHLDKSGNPWDALDAPRSLELAHAAGFENVLSGRVEERSPEDGVMHIALQGGGALEVPLETASVGETVQVAIRAGDILLATQLPQGLSARNVLSGKVESLEARGPIVHARVNAGTVFTVHVTPSAVRNLGLALGSAVWLVIKTHSCHVLTRR
jgi:molybdate transport system ATP-binding protein